MGADMGDFYLMIFGCLFSWDTMGLVKGLAMDFI
jgi:hypothetical protein